MKLSESFRDAMETCDIRPTVSERSVWFYDREYKIENFYYPLTIEQRLINAVNAGDFSTAEDQLRQVYTENIVKRDLSPSMLQYLINELEGSLLKSVHRISEFEIGEKFYEEELMEIDRSLSYLEKFQKITEAYKRVCETVRSGKQDKSARTIKRIIEYLNENYATPNLSLSGVADEFDISGGYLSILFKTTYGENFSSFLEKKRIEQACSLLEEGATLERIAANVGYNSVQVLRKAFRRSMGINPNDYRESIRNK
jgi:YesN/AraC family two-component response regulator